MCIFGIVEGLVGVHQFVNTVFFVSSHELFYKALIPFVFSHLLGASSMIKFYLTLKERYHKHGSI